jgi:hypothetical protein
MLSNNARHLKETSKDNDLNQKGNRENITADFVKGNAANKSSHIFKPDQIFL